MGESCPGMLMWLYIMGQSGVKDGTDELEYSVDLFIILKFSSLEHLEYIARNTHLKSGILQGTGLHPMMFCFISITLLLKFLH